MVNKIHGTWHMLNVALARTSPNPQVMRCMMRRCADPHNLHTTSHQAINTYLAERLKNNPSVATLSEAAAPSQMAERRVSCNS